MKHKLLYLFRMFGMGIGLGLVTFGTKSTENTLIYLGSIFIGWGIFAYSNYKLWDMIFEDRGDSDE